MKKLITILAILISAYANAQVAAVNDTVRITPTAPTFSPQFQQNIFTSGGVNYRVRYDRNPSTGTYDFAIYSKYLRAFYLAKVDSVLNSGYVSHWYFNSHGIKNTKITDTTLWSSSKNETTDLSNRGTQAQSFNNILSGVKGSLPSLLPFIREETSTRFEVFLPYNSYGQYQQWRFTTTGIAESFGASGFVKPYQMDLINDATLTDTVNYTIAANATLVGTWITSGAYKYSVTTGNTMTFAVNGGNSIRLTYVSDNNQGIAYIKVDGKNPTGYPVDGTGNAYIDMYAASTANATTFFNGLVDTIGHTVQLIVSGLKNPASSGYRVNAENSSAAIRTFGGYTTKTPIDYTYTNQFSQVANFTIKPAGSAVTYAIGYRPANQPTYRTDFIGAVHGYEQLDSLKFYFDGVETTFNQSPYTHVKSFKSLVIKQKTRLSHSQDLTRFFANVTTYHMFDSTGYHQTYTITWTDSVFIANGYSQMWTALGGNQGGDQHNPNGWCNMVTFKGFDTDNIQKGTSSDTTSNGGHVLTNEAVLWGTIPDTTTQPLRYKNSGNLAEVVTITNLEASMNYYRGHQSINDGFWANSRNTLKKLYLQPFRGKGNTYSGESWGGDMRVTVYNSPNINRMIDPGGITAISSKLDKKADSLQVASQLALKLNISDLPTSLPPSGAAGGDLSGTYPNPTINQINGITKSYYDPTSSIQTQLNARLLKTDTASMLSGYGKISYNNIWGAQNGFKDFTTIYNTTGKGLILLPGSSGSGPILKADPAYTTQSQDVIFPLLGFAGPYHVAYTENGYAPASGSPNYIPNNSTSTPSPTTAIHTSNDITADGSIAAGIYGGTGKISSLSTTEQFSAYYDATHKLGITTTTSGGANIRSEGGDVAQTLSFDYSTRTANDIFRIGRNTKTTGTISFIIHLGDSTSTAQNTITNHNNLFNQNNGTSTFGSNTAGAGLLNAFSTSLDQFHIGYSATQYLKSVTNSSGVTNITPVGTTPILGLSGAVFRPFASAVNSTATATAAQMGGGLITSTSGAATTITTPTATALATQIAATAGTYFDFTIDNTAGANTVTLALGSGFTLLNNITGSTTLSVVSGTAGVATWRVYFSSTTAATISRIQ